MEAKIKQFVKNQLYYYSQGNKEELHEEISGNLIERYYDFLKEVDNEQTAYLKTIGLMGEFLDEDLPDDGYRLPIKLEDLAMLLGSILSGVGFFLLFFMPVAGIMFTIASIVLFVIGAHFSYGQAQYARKKDGNMAVYVSRLKRIFSYVKSCFVFWAGSATLLLSALIYTIYIFVRSTIIYSSIEGTTDYNEIINVIGSVHQVFLTAFVVFLISLIIVGFLTYFVYWKFIEHYEMLTGEKNLNGGFGQIFSFLKQGKITFSELVLKVLSIKRLAIGSLIFAVIPLTFSASARIDQRLSNRNIFYQTIRSMLYKEHNLIGLEFILLSLIGLVLPILILKFKWYNRLLTLIAPIATASSVYFLLQRSKASLLVDFLIADSIKSYYQLGVITLGSLTVISLIAYFINFIQKKE